jgi:hypothetical protein
MNWQGRGTAALRNDLDEARKTNEKNNLPKIRRLRRLWRLLGLGLRQTEKERLLTDIAGLEAAIARYKQNTSTSDRTWEQRCALEIDMAKRAANKGMVGSGYEHFHNAERESVPGMNSEERRARAMTILREAADKKFQSPWRRSAVYDLLGEKPLSDGSLPSGAANALLQVSKELLMESILHRNTGDRNRHRKLDRLRWQLSSLSLLIAFFVVAAVVAARYLDWAGVLDLSLFPEAVFLGSLGGLLSAALSARKSNQYATVPEIQNDWYLTVARGMTGGAVAIPVYVLVKWGIIAIPKGDHGPWDLLFLCFLAGFSERWFLGVVGSAASGKDNGSDKGA